MIRPICTILITVLLSGCSTIDVQLSPKFTGIDQKIAPLYNEFIDLAKKRGIFFKKIPTIGVERLEEGTVGFCQYGFGFREISIDEVYWKTSTLDDKKATVFHELGHCLCHRRHDFDKKLYESTRLARFLSRLFKLSPRNSEEMYFPDRCPKSLMYPSVFEDECMKKHLEHYMDELFEGCIPW